MYYVEKIKDAGTKSWFVLVDSEEVGIVEEATKYLKHKTLEECSPNTIRKMAYSLAYYYEYIRQANLTLGEVLLMKYAEQHEHFVGFLMWLKAGRHTCKERIPNNTTCNSYLEMVFGFYCFLLSHYEPEGRIRVLEDREVFYSGEAGVRFGRGIKTFRGYLPAEEAKGRTVEEDKIIRLLEATSCIRDKLLILLLAETGFRIGELLGVKYSRDIDYDNHTINVEYREDNPNEARAKYAEYRRALMRSQTFDVLMQYIAENRKLLQNTEFLFVNLSGENRGKPMSVNAVYSVFRGLERRTGIKATPHMFRHYYANERRKAGWSIVFIAQALGHRHLATTEQYMNIEDWELEEAMQQYYEQHAGLLDVSKLI